MILFRRLLTIPLAVILLFLVMLSVLLLQLSGSFLNPDYYQQELRKADIYKFILVDFATSALDEARELEGEDLPENFDTNPLVSSGLTTQDIVSSINRAVPPEWLQSIVEQFFGEFGMYLVGRRDEFQVRLEAGERASAIVEELKTLVLKADFYNFLFDEVVTPAVEDAAASELPLGIDVSSEQLLDSVKNILPPEWVRQQLVTVIDEIEPFLIGERDTFEIRINLMDLVPTAVDETKEILQEADAYDLLYEEIVDPILEDVVGQTIDLPIEVAITNDEVVDALRDAAPSSWVQEQAETIIDETSSFLTGEADGFEVDISLEENKEQARDNLTEIVTEHIVEAAEELPPCSRGQTLNQVLRDSEGRIPECLPQGTDPEELAVELEPAVSEAVDNQLLEVIPNEITFTDALIVEALIQAGAVESEERLDEFRDLIRNGWTYSQDDLYADIRDKLSGEGEGDDRVESFQNFRAFLSDGWVYTEADFRESLSSSGDDGSIQNFDSFRGWFNRARTLLWFIFLPVIGLLAAIGFLGGQSWTSRVSWAAGALAITSGLALIVFMIAFGGVVGSRVDAAKADAIASIDLSGSFAQTSILLTSKMFEIAESVASGFTAGVLSKAAILLVIGLITLAVALGWDVIKVSALRLTEYLQRRRMGPLY